jgi:hypothetical protein
MARTVLIHSLTSKHSKTRETLTVGVFSDISKEEEAYNSEFQANSQSLLFYWIDF